MQALGFLAVDRHDVLRIVGGKLREQLAQILALTGLLHKPLHCAR